MSAGKLVSEFPAAACCWDWIRVACCPLGVNCMVRVEVRQAAKSAAAQEEQK